RCRVVGRRDDHVMRPGPHAVLLLEVVTTDVVAGVKMVTLRQLGTRLHDPGRVRVVVVVGPDVHLQTHFGVGRQDALRIAGEGRVQVAGYGFRSGAGAVVGGHSRRLVSGFRAPGLLP